MYYKQNKVPCLVQLFGPPGTIPSPKEPVVTNKLSAAWLVESSCVQLLPGP